MKIHENFNDETKGFREEKNVIVELQDINKTQYMDGINKRDDWNGELFIITDYEFMRLLSGKEYSLYCALNTIKYHNGDEKYPTNYLWKGQLNYTDLSDGLKLFAGKNKLGQSSTVSRQTISRLVNSLIHKGVLKKRKVEGINEELIQYVIMPIKEKLFIKVERELLKSLTTIVSGQVIKTYLYVKALYENALRNGEKELKISRMAIAKAINEVSKKGNIRSRQLQNITNYLEKLYSINLLRGKMIRRENINGTYSSIIIIENVNQSLESINLEI